VPAAAVLIVDDASPDGTGELADRLSADDPHVRVLHRARKDGLGRAYLAGFDLALAEGRDFVVELDADGSHDPAALPAMLELAQQARADLVLGSRWVPGGSVVNWPWIRQAISRTGNRYAKVVLRSRIQDLTSGCRVFRVEALRRLTFDDVSSQGYCFQVELAWRLERAGCKVVEHPIAFVERANGRSKMHLGIVLEALVRVTMWGLTRRR
jgi:dolichol-phosphate mannosyltransferase